MQQIELNDTLNIKNICSDIAQKLSDSRYVISTCSKESNLIPIYKSTSWNSLSLAYGYPGLICCFAEMNHFFPNQKWNLVSHDYISRVVSEVKTKGISNHSLFSGTAGICFALDMASQENDLYNPLRKQLHAYLLEHIPVLFLKPISEFIESSQPVYPYLYDTISGVIGILAYLLNHAEEKDTLLCIQQILQVLVKLTEPTEGLPGWFIASKDLPASKGDMSHLLGVCDTGLAHGISGCLAIFAKASIAGINVPGQVEAMQRIVNWLKSHRRDIGEFKDVWPTYIHFQNQKEIVPQTSYRDGWCYGAPGIVFSLFLASCALKDSNLYDYAVDAMESVCNRFSTQNTLFCPSICHGQSGLLAIVHQMYLATKSEVFLQASNQISEHILKQYLKEFPFGFKSDFTLNNQNVFIDNPGLLEGAAGIVLSLLFKLSDSPRPWLPIFLIG